MSQTDPTENDPQVYLLQSPKTYRINALPTYCHKYTPIDVYGYVVFAKTRKPKYNSINPVKEVAQIIYFPFYTPDASHLDARFQFDFPGDTKNYFTHWQEQFAQYFERPVLSGGISHKECKGLLSRESHYGRLCHKHWTLQGLAVPSWSRENIWNPLVQQYGWTSVTPSPQMKAALLPQMEKTVQEWEQAHNPNSYLQSVGKKQTKYNYNKTYLPLEIKEIEQYNYEPSRNYALDA